MECRRWWNVLWKKVSFWFWESAHFRHFCLGSYNCVEFRIHFSEHFILQYSAISRFTNVNQGVMSFELKCTFPKWPFYVFIMKGHTQSSMNGSNAFWSIQTNINAIIKFTILLKAISSLNWKISAVWYNKVFSWNVSSPALW